MSGAGPAPTIVFLHIPKTAGQTIHFELERILGSDAVSPVRVHTEAGPGAAQMPPGYRVYSGHIDWEALEDLPEPRFTFTVLRDPLERIASFYFYVRRQAEAMDKDVLARPEFTGMRRALNWSAEEYFFGGDGAWQRFILDHYHTPYCSYLATRKIRGYAEVEDMPRDQLLRQALQAARGLSGVYTVDGLAHLETDLATQLGTEVRLAGRFANADPEGLQNRRWPRLEALIEREGPRAKLRRFALLDQRLMFRLGLGPKPE